MFVLRFVSRLMCSGWLLVLCSQRAGGARSDDHLPAARSRLHGGLSARTQVHQDRIGRRPDQGQDGRDRRDPCHPRGYVNLRPHPAQTD